MTMLIAIIALVYAISKANHIQTVNGQEISSYEDENEYRTRENQLNLNERNFRVAFKYGHALPHYSLDDPRYIRRIIRTWSWDEDITTMKENILPFHDCTEEDYDQFYPIRAEKKDEMDRIRKDPTQGFICLDWDDSDPLQLYGSWGTTASF